jgi:hypothetical protein
MAGVDDLVNFWIVVTKPVVQPGAAFATSSSAFLLHALCAATAFVLLHCNTPSFVPFLLVPVDLYPGSQPQSLVQGTIPESAFRTTWTDVTAASFFIPQHLTKLYTESLVTCSTIHAASPSSKRQKELSYTHGRTSPVISTTLSPT